MIETLIEYALWMLLYGIGVLAILYVAGSTIAHYCLYLPVPLRLNGSSLYYRDREISDAGYIAFGVDVIGGFLARAIPIGLVALALGYIGMLLGMPIPE